MPTTAGTLVVAGPAVPGRPRAVPETPQRYPQLLRGARRRWWKPLLALLLATVAAALAMLGLVALTAVAGGLLLGVPDLFAFLDQVTGEDDQSAVGFLALNLGLAALIPVAGLTVWAVHGVRPGYLSSVEGRLRWRWLLRCVLVLLPVWAAYLAVAVLLDPPPPGRPAQWVALLVVVLLTTPLQAAGEEYLFRGFVLQNFGAWFARPWLALVVPAAASAVLFAAAHGSPDPWILADLGCFAVGACVLAWRTGGLEAGIALHSVNNVLLFVVVVVFGGWEEAFVTEQTTSTPLAFAVSAAIEVAVVALLWWQAGRAGVRRTSSPPPSPTRPALGSGSTGFLALVPRPKA